MKKLKSINYSFPDNLWEKLHKDKPMNIKLGFDPTAPDIHIGHLVVLKLLKYLQSIGHNIVLIIGDFTAQIGDPTFRNKVRPALLQEEVISNSKTYFEQVYKVLDKDKVTIKFNSHWFKNITFDQIINMLSLFSLAQITERRDFKERIKNQNPLFINELVYPILQGYDSVAIKADVEVGGTDQIFNMLFGRNVQKSYGFKNLQGVIACNLITGTDGVNKMSKSLHNTINFIDSPEQIYYKVMSIDDASMKSYYFNLFDEVVESIGIDAKNDKQRLAYKIIEEIYGHKEFIVRQEIQQQDIFINEDKINIVKVVSSLINISNTECKRLIKQHSVSVDGLKASLLTYLSAKSYILKIGKKFLKKVNIKIK